MFNLEFILKYLEKVLKFHRTIYLKYTTYIYVSLEKFTVKLKCYNKPCISTIKNSHVIKKHSFKNVLSK